MSSGAVASAVYALATIPRVAALFAEYNEDIEALKIDIKEEVVSNHVKHQQFQTGLKSTLEVARLVTSATVQEPGSDGVILSAELRKRLTLHNCPIAVLRTILVSARHVRLGINQSSDGSSPFTLPSAFAFEATQVDGKEVKTMTYQYVTVDPNVSGKHRSSHMSAGQLSHCFVYVLTGERGVQRAAC